jgi:hypothetical protein
MRISSLIFAALSVFVAHLSTGARAYTVTPQFAAKIAELQCSDLLTDGMNEDQEVRAPTLLQMLAPWDPDIYTKLIAEIVADKKLTARAYQKLGSKAKYAELVVGGRPGIATDSTAAILASHFARLERLALDDASNYGRGVCDILRAQVPDPREKSKEKFPSAYRYASIAHTLLAWPAAMRASRTAKSMQLWRPPGRELFPADRSPHWRPPVRSGS